jgi:hypothetical protein
MIEKRVSVGELAEALGLSKRYTSTVVQGYMVAEGTRKKIDAYLEEKK